MTTVIVAVLGLLGVLATAVVGVIAGPSRHIRRMEATLTLVKGLDDDGRPTVREAALKRALDLDAVRYYAKIRDGKRRRLLWYGLPFALCLVLLPLIYVAGYYGFRSNEFIPLTVAIPALICVMLGNVATLMIGIRLVNGVDDYADGLHGELEKSFYHKKIEPEELTPPAPD